MKEDIRKIQGEYSVAPVSPSQTVDNDDNAIHCNEEWDMEDKGWFPSNRLEVSISQSLSVLVLNSPSLIPLILDSSTSFFEYIGGEYLRFLQMSYICKCT